MDHPSVKNVLSFWPCNANEKTGKEVLIFALYCTPPEGVSKSAVCLVGNWTTLHLVSLSLCGEGLSIRYEADTMWDSVSPKVSSCFC